MNLRRILVVQLKRYCTSSKEISSSRFNGNTQLNMWKFKENVTIMHSDPVRKLNITSGDRFLHTCSCFFYMNENEIKRKMDEISDKFGEAMELLSDARSSMGTVYFSDDMTDAEAMVSEVCDGYEKLLANLNSNQSKEVTRAIGLKMEELKAQLQLLKESMKE